MELARALTHRRRQNSVSNYVGPARAMSTRTGPIKRSAISNPVQLISTTNALAYSAPNIYPSSASSSSASSSAEDSDSVASLGASSRATTPEMTPADSPIEPNHLSCYFPARTANAISREAAEMDSPTIPQRAPSHTKRSHQVSARKRASSRASPPPSTIHMSPPTLPTFEPVSSKTLSDHPFGAELAQVNEVAEGYGARAALVSDEEEQFLIDHGLCKFEAEDYMDEIVGLYGESCNPFSSFAPVWF